MATPISMIDRYVHYLFPYLLRHMTQCRVRPENIFLSRAHKSGPVIIRMTKDILASTLFFKIPFMPLQVEQLKNRRPKRICTAWLHKKGSMRVFFAVYLCNNAAFGRKSKSVLGSMLNFQSQLRNCFWFSVLVYISLISSSRRVFVQRQQKIQSQQLPVPAARILVQVSVPATS